jgi:hypothetical protein
VAPADDALNQASFEISMKKRRRNKKLAERFDQAPAGEEGKKDDKKGGAAKKEDPKKEAPKKEVKKDKKQLEAEEEEARKLEEERIRKEEEERRALAEKENNFNVTQELRKYGGKLIQFNMDKESGKSQHYNWTIPIFFKDVDKMEKDEMKTMYIEARTCTIQRALVPNVEKLDFGEIPVAFRKTLEVMIKNIGTNVEELSMDAMTPYGGFTVLNARRSILPGETRPVLIEFKPFAQQVYEEQLIMYSSHTVCSVKLTGRGVRPEVRISPDDGLLYFANLLVGESYTKEFEIKNISTFPVRFNLLRRAFGVKN